MCGEKALVSNVPNWRWVTGMERGESSDERTEVKAFRAETERDSGRWKAGFRLEIMLGVKTRIDGFGVEAAGPVCRCGWGKGRICRRGRKVWRVRIGVRRRVLRRSESWDGGREASGKVG
jgi:hypothetical protein